MGDVLTTGTKATDVLYDHHAHILSLFKALEHIVEPETHAELVCDLFVELRVHSVLEQQIFYPAISHMLTKEQLQRYGKDLYLILALMLELERTESGEQFSRSLAIVADRFSQHVEEHDCGLFRKLDRSERGTIDYSALGRRLDSRKQELREKMHARMRPHEVALGLAGRSCVQHFRCA